MQYIVTMVSVKTPLRYTLRSEGHDNYSAEQRAFELLCASTKKDLIREDWSAEYVAECIPANSTKRKG